MMENDLNFRNPLAEDIDDGSRIFGSSTRRVIPSRPAAPPLPPRPYGGGSVGGLGGYGNYSQGYGSYGGGGGLFGGSHFGSGFGSYGMYGMNNYGYGRGFGSGYGGGVGGYSMMGGGDVENRFIQIAEENSRGAFQSIESVVGAALNIASMLESTYFALTNSFRAVLGVAANFGHIKSLFAQVWSTFAIFRSFNWLFKKILFALKITQTDPGPRVLTEAFAAAESGSKLPERKQKSSMAVLAFLAFIMTAPYLLMKLIGSVSNTALEETRNPRNWLNPVNAIALYDFVASNQAELSIRTGQTVIVAPRSVQNTHKLLESGWVMATIDGERSGLIPVNYIESVKQTQERRNKIEEEPAIIEEKIEKPIATMKEEAEEQQPPKTTLE